MKLLQVATVASTFDAFLLPFGEHFRAQGWRVDALGAGVSASRAIAEAFDSAYDVAWGRNPFALANASAVRRVRDLVAENAYDIVHVHTPVASFLTRYALRNLPRASRPAIVYTAHGFHFYRGQPAVPYAVWSSAERLAARWTDHIVVMNAEDYAAALELGMAPAERLSLMPGIGIDPAGYDRARIDPGEIARFRADFGIGPNVPILSVVGEFSDRKQPLAVLRAAALQRRQDAVMCFAGEGPLATEASDLAATLGIEERVRFLGFTDIRVLLAASTASVLFSKQEGLPRSSIESMCMGVPVIGSDIRGIHDLLEGECGMLVKPGDVEALALAMDVIVDEPATAARLAEAGRRRILEDGYVLEAIVSRYQDVYGHALAGDRHV